VVFVCVSKSAFLCKKAWQKTRFFEEKAPQKPFPCVKREVVLFKAPFFEGGGSRKADGGSSPFRIRFL